MTKSENIALSYHPLRREYALRLASQFKLTLANSLPQKGFMLHCGPTHLELRDLNPNAAGPLYAEFNSGKTNYRLNHAGKQQPLARAISIKSTSHPYVIDATAGLGRDAFILAALGCKVLLLERSPVFAALLADGLERASLNVKLQAVLDRLQLILADSRVYLSNLGADEKPDVIYLDPMYPARRKSALVKKEMRYARKLVGNDEDAPELLTTALTVARRRVVVKRPRLSEPLTPHQPDTCIKSKNTRYDIYLSKPFLKEP